MVMIWRHMTLGAVALAAAGLPGAARAEIRLASGVTATGSGSVVSDYRFRGISLSGEDPALQGTVNLNHASGFYVGIWGSTLEDTPLYGKVEFDLYAGYTREVAPGTTIDVGLLYYLYPGNDGGAGASDYFEPYGAIAQRIGPVTAKIGAAYAWEQDATGGGDNIYLFGEASGAIPGTPLSLVGHLGYSDGTLSPGGAYLNWRIGIEAALGPATVGIAYVDTDLPDGPNVDPTAVASLRLAF